MNWTKYIILCCVLLLFFSSATHAQTEKKQVVFIRYPIEISHFATVVNGFKQIMAQRGYVEGRNIEYIDILTKSADQSSIPDVIKVISEWRDSADMFITSGWISMYVREELKNSKIPQLFVPVLKSVAQKMLPSMVDVPDTNLSGIYLMYPPGKILRLTHFLLPDLKNYAYIYDSRIPADLIFKSAYEQLDIAEQHGITVHFIDLYNGVENVLTIMKQKKIEAYGGIIGSFRNCNALSKSGLPVITSFTLDIEEKNLNEFVRNGNMLAGFYNPFRYCGEQAAEMTADIFDGKNTINKTRPRPSKQKAFINMETARKFNMKVPFDALEAVDFVIK